MQIFPSFYTTNDLTLICHKVGLVKNMPFFNVFVNFHRKDYLSMTFVVLIIFHIVHYYMKNIDILKWIAH